MRSDPLAEGIFNFAMYAPVCFKFNSYGFSIVAFRHTETEEGDQCRQTEVDMAAHVTRNCQLVFPKCPWPLIKTLMKQEGNNLNIFFPGNHFYI